MHRHFLLFAAILVLIATGFAARGSASDTRSRRPNILLIMADDLGFSDLGCYGGEIATPHLDRLARGGLQFTQFYNTARCWPTRAALLTGYYAQQVRRDVLPGVPSGGRGKRPAWAPLLSRRLKSLGYRSYHSGKWHLDGMPIQNGFDRSYYLKDQGRFFNPRVHWEDDKKQPPVKPGSGYYGTIAISDHAIRCLKEHARSHGEQPFFHYLAFTAPHFPLHALPEDIARYTKTYQTGWETIRRARWTRQQKSGLAKGKLSPVELNVGPPYHFPEALKILGTAEVNRPLPWKTLNKRQQEFQSTKMALHAAMIDRMDREIGRVLDQLTRMGAIQNTLIMFLSDNGASAEIMVRSDGHDPDAAPGSAASYLCLGPGWSTSCNTPFRRHKTWVHEGGIATPLIVHWPARIESRGEFRSSPSHVVDIVPTILELVRPGNHAAKPTGKGDAPPFAGKSLVRTFAADVDVPRQSLWWLHEGNRAIRVGRWKLVAAKGDPWELYDLKSDRTETANLAKQHPDIVDRMQRQWHSQLEQFQSMAKPK